MRRLREAKEGDMVALAVIGAGLMPFAFLLFVRMARWVTGTGPLPEWVFMLIVVLGIGVGILMFVVIATEEDIS